MTEPYRATALLLLAGLLLAGCSDKVAPPPRVPTLAATTTTSAPPSTTPVETTEATRTAQPEATQQDSTLPAISVTAPGPAHCTAVAGKADRACTPGVRNPLVTQANIGQTICKKGWTATVRPPASYTNMIKAQQMPRYGLTGPPSTVEEDHLISLELGGDPRDPRNLWPQPWSGATGARTKDLRENALNKAVCNATMTLQDARAAIVREWTH